LKPDFFKNITINPDWKGFLTDESLKIISGIEEEIGRGGFTPDSTTVLRFFSLPVSSVKVIILGQDPYPQPGVATGRAFEVGSLRSWNEPFQNISLKNILRAIYKAYTGEIIKFNDLKTKFDNEFPVLPPNRLFVHWESQGVLLLNTSFTCEPGKPGSHRGLWEIFSDRLFSWINKSFPDITWFIWGADAAGITDNLHLKNTVVSKHPMMCFDGKGRDDDFLFGKKNCFEMFRGQIDWTGHGFGWKRKQELKLF
jgi:uracil-DNA glycosylase